MALIREFPDRGISRRFDYRAFHKPLNKMVQVKNFSVENAGSEAMVSLPQQPKLVFRAYMRDLVILEDTSRNDKNGTPIFEGDLIRADVQNEFGSFQSYTGPVVFDEDKWGFVVEFEGLSDVIDITGVVFDAEVVGNIFESLETYATPTLLQENNQTTQ